MKSNEQLEMLEEIVDFGEGEGKTPFVIDNDNLANWALKKIKLMEQERDRKLAMADYAISEYNMKKDQIKKECDSSSAYFKNQLANYFETVPKKSTKTTDSYALLHGKLIRSKNKVEYVRDEEALLLWLRDNELDEYIKIKETPDWASLKKEIQIHKNNVVTKEGLFIEGVQLIYKPDEFKIEIDK